MPESKDTSLSPPDSTRALVHRNSEWLIGNLEFDSFSYEKAMSQVVRSMTNTATEDKIVEFNICAGAIFRKLLLMVEAATGEKPTPPVWLFTISLEDFFTAVKHVFLERQVSDVPFIREAIRELLLNILFLEWDRGEGVTLRTVNNRQQQRQSKEQEQSDIATARMPEVSSHQSALNQVLELICTGGFTDSEAEIIENALRAQNYDPNKQTTVVARITQPHRDRVLSLRHKGLTADGDIKRYWYILGPDGKSKEPLKLDTAEARKELGVENYPVLPPALEPR